MTPGTPEKMALLQKVCCEHLMMLSQEYLREDGN
jgi:hypothetical protein